MLELLTAAYRALPYRPRCSSADGAHSWLCWLMLPIGVSTKCHHERHDR